jgi:hypothetical protein
LVPWPLCTDNPNLTADVSRFNLGWSPLLSLPDHDMSVQDLNDTPLQIKMSVKPESPESRRCVLVVFTCLHLYTLMRVNKKSLKIPKGQSETVYRRRTDNTIVKRKSTKGQTTIDKTYI